jgi:fatty acid desaturase
VLSHHHYSNTELDLEATGLEPWLRFVRSSPPNARGVLAFWHAFNFLIGPLNYLNSLRHVCSGTSAPDWALLLPALELLLLSAPNGFRRGLLLWTVVHGAATWLLMAASTPVHRSDYSWTAGCERLAPPEADFGRHVVSTTDDYMAEAAGVEAKLFAFASFNDHVAHHLFPTVDLSQQHRVRRLFLETCRERGVEYAGRSWADLARGTARVLGREEGEILYRDAKTK